MRLSFRAGGQSFYGAFTKDGLHTYSALFNALNMRYDSPTRREENSKPLSSFTLHSTKKDGYDHHGAIKSLVSRNEQVSPWQPYITAAQRHRAASHSRLSPLSRGTYTPKVSFGTRTNSRRWLMPSIPPFDP